MNEKNLDFIVFNQLDKIWIMYIMLNTIIITNLK